MRKVRDRYTGRLIGAAKERAGHITTAGRIALARSDFALAPGLAERRRGIKGRLPIDTIKRARNALGRAEQMHKRNEISIRQLARVASAVHHRYLSIGKRR